MIPSWVLDVLGVMAQLFIVLVGAIAALIVLFWLIDSNQRADAVRRNYPVVGRFRSLFIRLGEFFRTYMFALDREELPFNRAEREAVNRMSQGHGNIIPFGSTKLLTPVGTVLFVNCAYPVLEQDVAQTQPCEFGPYADTPYMAPRSSIFPA
jgi:hypothetical protein